MFVSAKRKETRNNDDLFQIAVFHQSVWTPFIQETCNLCNCCERTYVYTRTRARSPSSYSASAHARCVPCAAQHLATPTMILNFHEENIRDPKSSHEIHENIVPRNFGAIRYWGINLSANPQDVWNDVVWNDIARTKGCFTPL